VVVCLREFFYALLFSFFVVGLGMTTSSFLSGRARTFWGRLFFSFDFFGQRLPFGSFGFDSLLSYQGGGA